MGVRPRELPGGKPVVSTSTDSGIVDPRSGGVPWPSTAPSDPGAMVASRTAGGGTTPTTSAEAGADTARQTGHRSPGVTAPLPHMGHNISEPSGTRAYRTRTGRLLRRLRRIYKAQPPSVCQRMRLWQIHYTPAVFLSILLSDLLDTFYEPMC